jgi:AraC-like DNA-binding protein
VQDETVKGDRLLRHIRKIVGRGRSILGGLTVLQKVHILPVVDWGQLALEQGYFDQSHLIRDFVAFSGLSPADYLRRLHDLRNHGTDPIKVNHLPLVLGDFAFFQYNRLPPHLLSILGG